MSNRKKIISDIAEIIKDYKYLPESVDRSSNDSISSHVFKWVSQFSEDKIDLVLSHTHSVLSARYFSEAAYDAKISRIVNNKSNHKYFKNDCLLCAQSHGESQINLNTKLNNKIMETLGFEIPIIDSSNDTVDITEFEYIDYIDDFSFSAKLVGDDIINFIEKHSINNTKIRVLIFVFHSYGLFFLKRRLDKYINENQLNIDIVYNNRFWLDVNNDISEYYSCRSQVYFPEKDVYEEILLNNGLRGIDKYEASVFRTGSHDDCILGNEHERREIERIFTEKGFDIISHSESPRRSMKPLGFSTYKGFGFGGNIFSYRNCPNNTPLVFWWGAYQKTNNKAIDCWYPLMKRRGYYE